METKKPLTRYIVRIPKREGRIVSMVEHDGRILVASERRVYQVEGDRLIPLKFRKVKGERK